MLLLAGLAPRRCRDVHVRAIQDDRSSVRGAGAGKVDLAVGMGSVVACEHGVAATPMFYFLLDGKVRDSVSIS